MVVELPLIFFLELNLPYFTVYTHVLHISICKRTASNCVFLLDTQFLPHRHFSAWNLSLAFPLFHAPLPLKPRTTIRLCRLFSFTREPGRRQSETKIQHELWCRAAPTSGKKAHFSYFFLPELVLFCNLRAQSDPFLQYVESL